MKKAEITYLLEQYMLGRLTESESEALLEQTSQENEAAMLAVLQEYLETESAGAIPVDPAVLAQLVQRIVSVDKGLVPIRRKRRHWVWVAAAACLLGAGVFAWYTWTPKPPAIEVAQPQAQRFKNDVAAPAGSRAVLTLGSGQKVVLDSLSTGTFGKQGAASLVKTGSGKLAYNALDKTPAEIVYNTLTTGRGGQTSVVLADGTKVWLDASSSLRYPTAFGAGPRRVELTGQAYFEVGKKAGSPFCVEVGGMEVKALGTDFNVKAFTDESVQVVTLLGGKVLVSRDNVTTDLSPGQQARVSDHGGISRTDQADIEEVMAWKNGYFVFHGVDMQSLLREAARWYDVDVENRRKDNPKFYGEVSRSTPLSDLLKAMELSGRVTFGIEGKKIIVLP
ncbi:FecR family protein [Dinghuibacter silviterrae]|uniref:FecR family protein n=1 Tax=Dinghuibacter silviterrae TaxID=1539049 RepID=A0A4R8DUH8_9BACT|nr:FecR family protein [Dinghuibacter silviterrae]TDX00811.1 FecR family protein [Dinghuibacter silviterrae]